MSENTPPTASRDAAWVTVPVPQEVGALTQLCRDVEALFRVNPYLYFSDWRQTGPTSHHVEFENQSNQQKLALDFEVVPGPGQGFTVNYAGGLKRRTIFTIEPAAQGSRLTLTDDYEGLSAVEREARAAEVDKSLHAWGVALRAYFLRLKRWSWLPGWRWYLRRVWVPMKPSARRIVWLFYLITVVEFFFFLFVLLIYLIEQQNR
ncbi:MAG: hypothetical protein AAB315_00140 [Pseudomonadota bacterium]